jgi:hypothetical protein
MMIIGQDIYRTDLRYKMPKHCETQPLQKTEREAIDLANKLNLTVPDGEPKWIIQHHHPYYIVVRFTDRKV